jgi:hypothetical protein
MVHQPALRKLRHFDVDPDQPATLLYLHTSAEGVYIGGPPVDDARVALGRVLELGSLRSTGGAGVVP